MSKKTRPVTKRKEREAMLAEEEARDIIGGLGPFLHDKFNMTPDKFISLADWLKGFRRPIILKLAQIVAHTDQNPFEKRYQGEMTDGEQWILLAVEKSLGV